jgi:hypothetical protein
MTASISARGPLLSLSAMVLRSRRRRGPTAARPRLKAQLEILRSAKARLESSLFEMRKLAAADLFNSELDACRELAARGFLRAAGTIAGVEQAME